jgi:hypothetical protein
MRIFAVAIALLVAACAGGGERETASPSRATPATAAPFASPTPTPTIGPALERVDGTYVYGGSDVDHPAGIYAAPDFAFPFTAELNRDLGVRDSDQEETGSSSSPGQERAHQRRRGVRCDAPSPGHRPGGPALNQPVQR